MARQNSKVSLRLRRGNDRIDYDTREIGRKSWRDESRVILSRSRCSYDDDIDDDNDLSAMKKAYRFYVPDDDLDI